MIDLNHLWYEDGLYTKLVFVKSSWFNEKRVQFLFLQHIFYCVWLFWIWIVLAFCGYTKKCKYTVPTMYVWLVIIYVSYLICMNCLKRDYTVILMFSIFSTEILHSVYVVNRLQQTNTNFVVWPCLHSIKQITYSPNMMIISWCAMVNNSVLIVTEFVWWFYDCGQRYKTFLINILQCT